MTQIVASNPGAGARCLTVMTVALAVVTLLAATTPPNAAPPARPDAAAILDEALVRASSGFAGGFQHERMAAADATYSDVHLRAIARPEDHDVALRLWSLPAVERAAKLAQLRRDLPSVTDTRAIGHGAFFSEEPDIVGLVFEDDCGAIAMLTCGKRQCRDLGVMLTLARSIEQRLRVQCR